MQDWKEANCDDKTPDTKCRASRHIFWEGATIYSYGHHYPMAMIHGKGELTLLNSAKYSVTTQQHKSLVRYALLSQPIVSVPDVSAKNHQANVADLLSRIQRQQDRAVRARTRTKWYLQSRAGLVEDLKLYCDYFRLPYPSIPPMPDKLTVKLALMKLNSEEL